MLRPTQLISRTVSDTEKLLSFNAIYWNFVNFPAFLDMFWHDDDDDDDYSFGSMIKKSKKKKKEELIIK